MNLYEIQGQWLAALAAYDSAETQEQLDAAAAALQALDGQRDEKIEACCCYVKNLDSEAEALRAESKRLADRARQIEARSESVARYIGRTLAGEKWKRGVHSISWRKSTGVKILDETEIPTAYMREKLSYEPDKKLILEVLKEGGTVPGAAIEEKENIQIK